MLIFPLRLKTKRVVVPGIGNKVFTYQALNFVNHDRSQEQSSTLTRTEAVDRSLERGLLRR